MIMCNTWSGIMETLLRWMIHGIKYRIFKNSIETYFRQFWMTTIKYMWFNLLHDSGSLRIFSHSLVINWIKHSSLKSSHMEKIWRLNMFTYTGVWENCASYLVQIWRYFFWASSHERFKCLSTNGKTIKDSIWDESVKREIFLSGIFSQKIQMHINERSNNKRQHMRWKSGQWNTKILPVQLEPLPQLCCCPIWLPKKCFVPDQRVNW